MVWKPKIRTELIGMDADRMVAKYNLEIRGFYNYYCIANNVSATCTDFGYIMKYSLYKTLARKFNSTLRKIIRKYTKNNEFNIPYRDAKGNEKFRVLYHDGFRYKTNAFHRTCDIIPNTHFPKRSLAERLRGNVCELCGNNGSLVMHHARTLKSIKGDTGLSHKSDKRLFLCFFFGSVSESEFKYSILRDFNLLLIQPQIRHGASKCFL